VTLSVTKAKSEVRSGKQVADYRKQCLARPLQIKFTLPAETRLVTRRLSLVAFLFIATSLACSLLTTGCRSPVRSVESPEPALAAGEPENYSATVVRTIEDGEHREQFEMRVVRWGELFRQEWAEAGERYALILRPVEGKSFLLSLDRRVYVESNIEALPPDLTDPSAIKDVEEIDRAFGSPVYQTETVALPDQMIEGYLCRVVEKRTVDGGGRSEVTRLFLARDLAGLAVRVETESSGPPRLRIVTERRDLRTEVSADEFNVPPEFERVDYLGRK
jgi:hypothetical protein